MNKALQIEDRARVVGGRAQNTESCCCESGSWIVLESLDCGDRVYMRCYDIASQGSYFECEGPDGCLPVGTIIRTDGDVYPNQCWRVVEVVTQEPSGIPEVNRGGFQQECFGESDPGCVDYSDVFCPKECERYFPVSEYYRDGGPCRPCGDTIFVTVADVEIEYEAEGEIAFLLNGGGLNRTSLYRETGLIQYRYVADPNTVGQAVYVNGGVFDVSRSFEGRVWNPVNGAVFFECEASDQLSIGSDFEQVVGPLGNAPALCSSPGTPFLTGAYPVGPTAWIDLLTVCDQSQSGPPEIVVPEINFRTYEQMGCLGEQTETFSDSDSCSTTNEDQTWTFDYTNYYNCDASNTYVFDRIGSGGIGGCPSLIRSYVRRFLTMTQRVTYRQCVPVASSSLRGGWDSRKDSGLTVKTTVLQDNPNRRMIEGYMAKSHNCKGCGG